MWEQRNTINHGGTNIVTKIQRTQYILELKEWKRHAASRLGASQVYLIDYDIPTISHVDKHNNERDNNSPGQRSTQL